MTTRDRRARSSAFRYVGSYVMAAALMTFVYNIGGNLEAQGPAPQYSVTDLGAFHTTDINSNGSVVGYNDAGHVYFWSQGVLTDLGSMGGTFAVASGINDSGQIAGTVRTSNGIEHFIFTNGSVLNIGAPTDNYYGYGINNLGEVANTIGGGTPFLYSNGTFHNLPLAGCSQGIAADINDAGVITGSAIGGDCGHQSAVVWHNGNLLILPLPAGCPSSSQPGRINAAGEIAGWVNCPSAQPILWQPDGAGHYSAVSLGLTADSSGAYPLGVNDMSAVVGELDTNTGVHPFLWTAADGLRDLNPLVPQGTATLGAAVAINNAGMIVGEWIVDGAVHTYLLTPVTPATQIQNLINSTLITDLSSNIQTQLDAKLMAALGTLDAAKKNSAATAANQLQAFVNAVKADVQGGKLTCAQAGPLVSAAQAIVALLGQPPLTVSLPCQ